MFIFNPFSERQKMNVLAPLAGTPVRAFERRGQLERGANGAEARRHLRSFAAPRGRETTIETQADQLRFARR